MCNLYSITTTSSDPLPFFRVMPGVFPHYPAPIVRRRRT
jgi:hypothetical protein